MFDTRLRARRPRRASRPAVRRAGLSVGFARGLLAAGLLVSLAGLESSAGAAAVDEGGPRPAYERVLRDAVIEAGRRVESVSRLWIDRTRWENAWQVPSANLTVRTTRGRDFGERVAGGLESMFGWCSFVFGRTLPEGEKVNVWVLPDLPAYNQMGDDLSGDHSSKIGCFYAPADPARPVVTYYLRDELRGRQFATHGIVHAYLDRAFPAVTVPVWLVEGLASYFELHWRYADTVTAWRALRDRGGFIPLRTLRDAPLSAYTPDHFLELSMFIYYLLWDRADTCLRWDSESRSVEKWPARDWIVRVLTTGSIDGTFPEGSDLATVQRLLTTDLESLEADFRAHGFERTPGWESL